MKKIVKFLWSMTKREFWVSEFPKDLPPECFDCHLTYEGCCKECQYNKEVK